jgi:TonB-dependent starch-binding outer membrane protein SusC
MRMTPSGTARLAGAVVVTVAGLAACGRSPKSSSPTPRDSVEVGYGAQPKDQVTGAVTSMSGKDVPARPLQIEELLRGKVAGLQIIQGPNGPTFRIRGTGSVLIDQEPLVVVDGVQIPSGGVSSALAGLTPKDIKKVSVLKDVASTSIYGGRGAGGVILIVTNR